MPIFPSFLITLGETVGIIAAQSIGEPDTINYANFSPGLIFYWSLLKQINAPFV